MSVTIIGGSGGFCVMHFSPSDFRNHLFPEVRMKLNFETCNTKKEHTHFWLSLQMFHQYLCVFIDTLPCNNFGVNCAERHCSVLQDKMFQCLWVENSRVFFHRVDYVQAISRKVSHRTKVSTWE